LTASTPPTNAETKDSRPARKSVRRIGIASTRAHCAQWPLQHATVMVRGASTPDRGHRAGHDALLVCAAAGRLGGLRAGGRLFAGQRGGTVRTPPRPLRHLTQALWTLPGGR